MTSPSELRAGNDDRERAIAVLQEAYAEGRLSVEELRDRAAAAQQAVTFADLDALLADLPVAGASVSHQSQPGSSMENPLIIDAGWSIEKRDGDWQIPEFLLLRGSAGSVKLNCLAARTTHQVIHVWVDGGMGTVRIVLPDGWAADTSGVIKSMGTVRNKVDDTPLAGRPILVVNGQAGMGTLIVRYANGWERKKAAKELR
ncbi:hypothetical protein CGZ94_04265 [Enemella evansiae]|uniref:DUF1707 domain-containing protein n=1 Tax=Enemella evansiae TaxID=2016499 RepID=A0A255GPU4_9ACTN|nr:DUF1707 domain-containing protein [Enemella evansiae]OYO15907.1 hypothetical protein BI335_11545 [Enemella evansiae]OYO16403.1 hypothetical protein CGZ94_04265 [Enemella evansiae]